MLDFSHSGSSFSICDIRIQKQISRSFGKSSSYRSCTPFGLSTSSKGLAKVSHTFSPLKIVLPKLRPHCPATCPNTWRAEPRKKNTLSFFKEISPPPNQESKECFSFGVAEALRGSGGTIHSSLGFCSKYIRTLSRTYRQKMKSGSDAKIWSARSAVCSEFPPKILNQRVRHAERVSSLANAII